MKTLFLLRHAHTESRVLADFDRALDDRGREEAKALAVHIQTQKIIFDFVMCSAALRALETLEPLRPVIGTEKIEISNNFYNVSENDILLHIKHISDEWKKVLYIGHNPGIAFAMLRFSESFPEFLKERVHPATLVEFQLPFDKWEDLTWGEGKIIEVFRPVIAPKEPPSPRES